MPNSLQYASVFQSELDKAAVELATSGWMEPNSSLIRYTGGKTVKVPQIVMDGLADYNNGFVDGDVTLTWQDLTFAMDRGRRFSLDEHEVNDTNFVATASQVMGEFQRTRVVPEIDATATARSRREPSPTSGRPANTRRPPMTSSPSYTTTWPPCRTRSATTPRW